MLCLHDALPIWHRPFANGSSTRRLRPATRSSDSTQCHPVALDAPTPNSEEANMRAFGYWGNDRIAFVPMLGTFESEASLGTTRLLLVFRKAADQWKLLTAASDPISTRHFALQVTKLTDSVEPRSRIADAPIPAKLLTPDGIFFQPEGSERFGDFRWQPSPSANVVAEACQPSG